MKLLVAADPWVLSVKTGCPGIAIAPGTQVFKMPHGLLVNHTGRYSPRTTMLRVIKEGDAGEQLNCLPQWLSHSCQGTCVHTEANCNAEPQTLSQKLLPFTSSSAEQDRTSQCQSQVRQILPSSVPRPQHPHYLLLSFLPWGVSADGHSTTWMQALLPLWESSLAFS